MLIAGGPGDQKYGAIEGLCREILVAWSDDRYDRGDIMGMWLNARGLQPFGPRFLLVRSPGFAEQPALHVGPNVPLHHMRVYFTDDRNGTRDIYAKDIFDDINAPIDPTAGHMPIVTGPNETFDPKIAVNAGRTLLAWTADSGDGESEIRGRMLHVNGHWFGAERLIAGGRGARHSPSIGPGERGGWLAAWADDSAGTLDVLGVFVRQKGWPAASRLSLAAD